MIREAIVHILYFYESENKMKLKANQKPGMVAYSHNSSTWESQQEDFGFKTSLSCIV